MKGNDIVKEFELHSFCEIFFKEWRWWLLGGVFSFILASVLMSGWPAGVLPNLSYPYAYQGDGLSHSWLTLRALEGWVFENPRSGYPFGSNFLDYPGSDSGNLLILKVIGLLAGEYYYAINLFFLLSFSAVFVASFCALRAFDLSKVLAFSAAVLFAFLPFHFQRIAHLFYLWYFVVPIFFYLSFLFFYKSDKKEFEKLGFIRFFVFFVLLVFLASFGVYYALFGTLLLASSAVLAYAKTGRIASTFLPLATIAGLILGVFLNVAPNLVNKKINGPNLEVAVRSPAEAEIYGLKLMQLVLPRLSHREPNLASLTERYSKNYPLINENSTASLGLIGAAGFMGSFFLLLAGMSGRKIDSRLSIFAVLVLTLFLFGTIGGFGSLFSAIVSSSIRGWNRISVFIAFGAIAIFFITLQNFITRYFAPRRAKTVLVMSALFFGGIGLYDQTIPVCIPCNEQTKIAFNNNKQFVADIEKILPGGSAVYQLPYMPFPEVAPIYRLHTYDLSVGFLHSKDLRWSYAGMKGREGDLFYRALSQEPIEKQLEVVRRMGFAGIYIDRRGFDDNADALISRLSVLLGDKPLLTRADGEVVFFRLTSPLKVDFSGLKNSEIMKRAGYIVDQLGARHSASFSDGIDFRRRTWPEFVRDVQGISGPESWGRWSDANLSQGVRFDFFSSLPVRFTLVLSAQPFGRNGEQTIFVKIDNQTHRLKINSGQEEIRLPIVLNSDQVDSIEFIVQDPVSPQELGLSGDTRKLGIGFIRLRFEE